MIRDGTGNEEKAAQAKNTRGMPKTIRRTHFLPRIARKAYLLGVTLTRNFPADAGPARSSPLSYSAIVPTPLLLGA